MILLVCVSYIIIFIFYYIKLSTSCKTFKFSICILTLSFILHISQILGYNFSPMLNQMTDKIEQIELAGGE